MKIQSTLGEQHLQVLRKSPEWVPRYTKSFERKRENEVKGRQIQKRRVEKIPHGC